MRSNDGGRHRAEPHPDRTADLVDLQAIVDRVRPAVEGLIGARHGHDGDALVREAVRANIRASANHLRHGSQVLEQLIQEEGLLVVGAEYSLESGVVEFFDGAV